jgi:Rrf2 family protein
MKLLTKNTDYAVRAVLVLATNPTEFISSRDIAEKQKIPYQFLRRILQVLIKNKVIESKEGVSGGVRILKDASDIKIIDLIALFQGEIELSECMFRKKICENRDACVLRCEIKRIENIVNKEFGELTIKKLMDKTGGVR